MIKVTCALIVSGDKILVAQRGPESSHPFLWEFPGGKIKPGETPEACIRREIAEELDIEIEIITGLLPVQYDYGTKLIELIPFLCTIKSGRLKFNVHVGYEWKEWDKLDRTEFSEADRILITQAQNIQFLKEYFGEQVDNAG
ncbi:MAG: NUDIX domain-containing protein [Bacteroidia bacterium]|nr:NUDIX domain-containing protein [Bacteroidia bacterium]